MFYLNLWNLYFMIKSVFGLHGRIGRRLLGDYHHGLSGPQFHELDTGRAGRWAERKLRGDRRWSGGTR